jgi:hypothetical protein
MEELPKTSENFYPGYIFVANNVPHIISCTVPSKDVFDECTKCRQGHVMWNRLTKIDDRSYTIDNSSNIKYEGEIVEYPSVDSKLNDVFDISNEFYKVFHSGEKLSELKETVSQLKIEDVEKLVGKKMSDELKENYPKVVKKLTELVMLMVFLKWVSES